MQLTFKAPAESQEPKATFTVTISNGKREVIAIGELNLDATIWHDNYENTKRAIEQAIYCAFFNPGPDDTANGSNCKS